MLLLSFIVMITGFAMLALAMDRHHRDAFAGVPTAARRKKLRIGGTGLLLLSLLACIAADGATFGAVWFVGQTALAGLIVLLALAFVPYLRKGTVSRNARGNIRTPNRGNHKG